jgi:type I restriction enzyme M protein
MSTGSLRRSADQSVRGDSERSWTVPRADIEAKNLDLKAVNPHAKSQEDARAPEELRGV